MDNQIKVVLALTGLGGILLSEAIGQRDAGLAATMVHAFAWWTIGLLYARSVQPVQSKSP